MEDYKGFVSYLPQKGETGQPVRKKGRGFTLIELLVVVAIIVILAAAVMIGVDPARVLREGRHSTRWKQMEAIAGAVYSYMIAHQGVWPECIPVDTDSTVDIAECEEELVPIFLTALPVPPQANTEVVDGEGEQYMIGFLWVDNIKYDRIIITSTAPEANVEGEEIELIK